MDRIALEHMQEPRQQRRLSMVAVRRQIAGHILIQKGAQRRVPV
jgi:hypothetical protein